MKERALIGSNLTQGAWTKIGKMTKKEDHNLNDIEFDKKLFSYESKRYKNLNLFSNLYQILLKLMGEQQLQQVCAE